MSDAVGVPLPGAVDGVVVAVRTRDAPLRAEMPHTEVEIVLDCPPPARLLLGIYDDAAPVAVGDHVRVDLGDMTEVAWARAMAGEAHLPVFAEEFTRLG